MTSVMWYCIRNVMLQVWVHAAVGCTATTRSTLPSHPSMSDEASLDVIAERLGNVHTVSARCEISLSDSAGDSAQLDGAFVAALPDRLRIRTWKMGHAVFDLTFIDGQTWLMAPSEPEGGKQASLEALRDAPIGEATSLLGPEYFQRAEPIQSQSSTSRLVVAAPALGHGRLMCVIDRQTLTPRRFFVPDNAAANPEAVLELDDYRLVADVPWPTTIRFRGRQGELIVQLSDVEINGALPPSAFVPPSRAVQQP